MRGFSDNKIMQDANSTFIEEAETEPTYRLFSIGDRHPAMLRVTEGGTSVAVEIWAVPVESLGIILTKEPPGLCIGKVRLSSGEIVLGVLGELMCCESGKEITEHSSWRNYLKVSNPV